MAKGDLRLIIANYSETVLVKDARLITGKGYEASYHVNCIGGADKYNKVRSRKFKTIDECEEWAEKQFQEGDYAKAAHP
jgi:hypothetical protein